MTMRLRNLTDRSFVRLIRVAAGAGVSAAVISTVMAIILIGPLAWFAGFNWFIGSFAIFFGILAFLVAPKEPRNALVWIMASAAFFGGVTNLGWPVAGLLGGTPGDLVGDIVPADLPRSSAWVLSVTGWLWVLAMLPPLTFGLLLFPNGRLPSSRWKWVGVLAGVGLATTSVASAWSYRPSNNGVADDSSLINASWLIVLLAAIFSLAALIQGFRRSNGLERQRYKWVAWGTSIFIPTFLGLGFALGGSENASLLVAPLLVAELIFLGSYGMAVGKYRLFEIDRIISRTVTYTVVAAVLTGLYFGSVTLITSLLPTQNALAVAGSTLAVAALFNPLRRRIQRVVDRRFNRSSYHAEIVSDQFSAKLSQSLTVEELSQLWRQTITEAFQPSHTGIWLNSQDTDTTRP